jgi:hypothetical protein
MAKQPIPSGPDSNPPGGGRWTWDEARRQWVSLDQVAEPVAEVDAKEVPE